MLWQLICAEDLSLFRKGKNVEIRLQVGRKFDYLTVAILPLVILLTIHIRTAFNIFWVIAVP